MGFVDILLKDQNVSMQYETVIMLITLALPALFLKDERRLGAAWTLIVLFFTYIHKDLLPFIVSGVWFMLIAGVLSAIIALRPDAALQPLRIYKKKLSVFLKPGLRPLAVIILLIFLIQLSRINIAVDYDSLRYGLRSDVLLSDDGIAGFFRGIGLVNTVYTYPKGYEVLILPLTLLDQRTYGYALTFDIWVLSAVLLVIGAVTEILVSGCAHVNVRDRGESPDEEAQNAGAIAMTAAALMPGITNMSITAKSDLITLLMQLIFVLAVIRYLSPGRPGDCFSSPGALTGIGTGALIMSYAFKPTALIFSSLLGLTALLYFLKKKIRLRLGYSGAIALTIGFFYTLIMTVRTFLITGQPFTSIFTGLFSKLGMRLKYPFREQSLWEAGTGSGTLENIEKYLFRLLKFMFCPTGTDMEHVIMAWGGLVFSLLLIYTFFTMRRTLKNAGELRRLASIKGAGSEDESDLSSEERPGGLVFMCAELLVTLATSLTALWFLAQVDGNYFMLLYALTAALGCAAIMIQVWARLWLTHGSGEGQAGGFASYAGLVLLSVVMIYSTEFTSWNGACGFTPVDFVNRGYYNHEAERGIKNPLGWDIHTRVVGFAAESDCYRLRGRVESFVDIDGSGGNVYLTDTKLDIFKEYLSFADIDYLYVDLQYIRDDTNTRRERAGTLFSYLLEDGCFEDMVLEEGSNHYLYLKIDKERMAVSWEEDMGQEREERTAGQISFYESLIG